MSEAEQVDTVSVSEDVGCPEWISAYAIGLSSAGVGPHTISARLAALHPTPELDVFDEAIRRTRALHGLDTRLRWTALVALRLATRRVAPLPR